MQFEFTEEQRLIQNMASEFFRDRGSSEALRAALESERGYDADIWRQMAQELGFAGLTVSDAYGGQGLGLVEAAIVYEQMGRTLLPSPMLGTGVLAATAIEHAGSETQKREWLPQLAGGNRCAALAVCGRGGAHGSARVDAVLEDGRVHGTYRFVLDAQAADLIIAAARRQDEVMLVALPRDGVEVERHVSLDLTRPHHTVRVRGVEPRWELPGSGAAALDVAIQRACILLAAEQTGAAAEALDRTVAYARERVQFGRAIGSFQAVKHRLADMMIQVEAAISAVYFAACSADEAPATLPQMASLAKVQATETLTFCAANMVQLHGGIGFTWEHDAHYFFKRARASATLFGSVAEHQERLAVHMGLEGEAVS